MYLRAPVWFKKITTPKFRRILAKFLRLLPTIIFPWMGGRSAEIAGMIDRATYAHDGFVTTHHVEFLHDHRFNSSFQEGFQDVPDWLKSKHIEWRAHICCWAASQAIHLEGDFVEVGVWYGFLSKTICEYVDFGNQKRNFYLVDSFGAMPESHPREAYQQDIFDLVKKRFAKYSNVSLVRGLVPEILSKVPSQKVAYLSIDMNGSEPERAALEYFYEKMVPGGVIYFDDYGWGYPELRNVVNKFFADKPETLLHFPSGNSIVVKL